MAGDTDSSCSKEAIPTQEQEMEKGGKNHSCTLGDFALFPRVDFSELTRVLLGRHSQMAVTIVLIIFLFADLMIYAGVVATSATALVRFILALLLGGVTMKGIEEWIFPASLAIFGLFIVPLSTAGIQKTRTLQMVALGCRFTSLFLLTTLPLFAMHYQREKTFMTEDMTFDSSNHTLFFYDNNDSFDVSSSSPLRYQTIVRDIQARGPSAWGGEARTSETAIPLFVPSQLPSLFGRCLYRYN